VMSPPSFAEKNQPEQFIRKKKGRETLCVGGGGERESFFLPKKKGLTEMKERREKRIAHRPLEKGTRGPLPPPLKKKDLFS